MKILHLIDIPWWSGLTAYAFDCATAHRDAGHKVLFACQKNSLSYKKSLEMEFETLPISGRESWNSFFNFISIGMAIARKKPDAIIAHTGSTHWIAWWWGKYFNRALIRTRATSQSVVASALNRKIYSQSWWIITPSEKLKEECLSKLSLDQENNIKTIYPPSNFEKEWSPINTSVQKIGILARLDSVKGHWVFLKMAEDVQKKYPGAQFHIAGPEENLKWSALLKEIRNLNLKNIFYHGFLPQEKVCAFLMECTIGVVASLGSEEVSRALMEWMSAGRPVVASDVGCISEVLNDRLGGFVVPPNNPEEMARRIKELLDNPSVLMTMGQYNYKYYMEKFSKERFRCEWERVLSE